VTVRDGARRLRVGAAALLAAGCASHSLDRLRVPPMADAFPLESPGDDARLDPLLAARVVASEDAAPAPPARAWRFEAFTRDHDRIPQETSSSQPTSAPATGADDENEIAKKLANPVASLISVPLQNNSDFGVGRNDGFRNTLNIQPVIPFSLTEQWNVITRTIVPVVWQNDIPTDGDDAFGLGDTTQSFFFSPVAKPGAPIWGVGPAFLWPTSTDKDELGSGKWGAGPTGVLLAQEGPWTLGGLANHIWSYAGDRDRPEVNQTFLNPFVSHIFGKGTTIIAQAEATYDWHRDDWQVPVAAGVSQVLKVGGQVVSLGLQGRYWAYRQTYSPEWGIRFILTFVFPK